MSPELLQEKLKFATVHLLISAFVLMLAAIVVSQVWYPDAYFVVDDAWAALKWLLLVDVLVGPLFSFVVYASSKPRQMLIMNMAVIISVQLVALGGGLHTLHTSKPAVVVYWKNGFFLAQDTLLQQVGIAIPEDTATDRAGVPVLTVPPTTQSFLDAAQFEPIADRIDFILGFNRDITEYVADRPDWQKTIDLYYQSHGVTAEDVQWFELSGGRNGSYLYGVSESQRQPLGPVSVPYPANRVLPLVNVDVLPEWGVKGEAAEETMDEGNMDSTTGLDAESVEGAENSERAEAAPLSDSPAEGDSDEVEASSGGEQ